MFVIVIFIIFVTRRETGLTMSPSPRCGTGYDFTFHISHSPPALCSYTGDGFLHKLLDTRNKTVQRRTLGGTGGRVVLVWVKLTACKSQQNLLLPLNRENLLLISSSLVDGASLCVSIIHPPASPLTA